VEGCARCLVKTTVLCHRGSHPGFASNNTEQNRLAVKTAMTLCLVALPLLALHLPKSCRRLSTLQLLRFPSGDANPEQALIHFEESDSTSEDETANIAEFNRRFVFRIYFLNIFIYLNTVIKINILY
jgi:hypothetical protein